MNALLDEKGNLIFREKYPLKFVQIGDRINSKFSNDIGGPVTGIMDGRIAYTCECPFCLGRQTLTTALDGNSFFVCKEVILDSFEQDGEE